MRAALLVVVAGCSIPASRFQPSPDASGSDGTSSVLAIVPSATSVVVDEGATASFTVALSQPPSEPLTVMIASSAPTKLAVALPTLTFTPTNFADPQTVGVSGLADPDTVDDHADITLTATGVDSVTVAGTVHDLDTVQIITDVGSDGTVTVDEGATAVVRVHLSAQPTGDVAVTAILGTGPVTVSPTMHVFTADNYDADQTFTFSAPVDANTISEDESLTFRAAGVPDKVLDIHDVDHDVLNISVSPSSLTVVEQGAAGVLNVSLTQQPSADLTVMVSTTTGQAAISTNALTFTPQNYATNQTVLVTGPDDPDTVDGSDTIKLVATGVAPRSVGVTIKDDDVQQILSDAPSPLALTENGNATFNATLKFKPTANVVVSVSSLDSTVATASPGTLTFTPLDYNTPHQVTVHGTDDNNLVTNTTSIRLFEASIGMTDVPVSVADDDHQIIVLSTNAITVPEGMTGTFDVSLTFDPGTTVTVNLANTNPTSLPLDKSSITFTSASYATPVHVTISPPVDSNNVGETATITASGASAPVSPTLTATVMDTTQLAQYGWPAPFTGTISIDDGTVVGYRIHVDATSNLDSFGLFVPAASGDYREALYTDSGGVPGTLVAQMPVRKSMTNGSNTADITPDPLVTVGFYWIVLRVGQTSAIGYSTGAVTAAQCVRNLDIPNLDDPWPTTFGAASCQTANIMNLWINNYHQ
jgi:hypothetical protein